MSDLAIHHAGELALLSDSARDFARGSRSAATLRAYRSSLRAFAAWCADRGIPWMPAHSSTVANYLSSLADSGKKVSTIERSLAAIAWAHRQLRHRWDSRDVSVRDTMQGIRRQLGVAPVQKAAVTRVELARMLEGQRRAGIVEFRDRAVILLGWFGAFRRSELVSLQVTDVEFTADGMIVVLRRSKTDQEGAGFTKGIAYQANPNLCAVYAVKTWLNVAALTEGPLLRRLHRGDAIGTGLNAGAVARIVKDAARAAGLDPGRFAGHSLRSGFATSAAQAKKALPSLIRQTGHKSEKSLLGYIRHASLFDDNATKGMF